MVNLKNLDDVIYSLKHRKMPIPDNIDMILKNYQKKYNDLNQLLKYKNTIQKSYMQQNSHQLYNLEKDQKLKHKIQTAKNHFLEIQKQYNQLIESLPNYLHKNTPIGHNYKDNQLITQWQDIPAIESAHYNMKNIIHGKSAILCGSRMAILTDQMAKIERGLINFTMHKLQQKQFIEFSLPYFITPEAIKNTGHAKFQGDMFQSIDKYLIPTSELLLINLFGQQNYTIDQLPLRYCAITDCFRKEAGSYGKDNRGLIRLHQFKKCEMVILCLPNQELEQLNYMIEIVKEILQELQIPYRVMLLCSGDIGQNATITYDIEIPIDSQWREAFSLSSCGDYQSKGIKAKYKKEFLYTLNGTAMATGRILASLLEIHTKNNIFNIPAALQKYIYT